MPNRMKWVYAGIFCLAGSIILFQIAMTRVFAIMMWHHFTYMVISMALLGFGAAGSIMTARREVRREGSPMGSLAGYASAYGISVILAFCFTTLVRIDSLEIWENKANFLALLLVYLILSVPLLLGGMAVGICLTRMAHRIDRLYFADLIGSAAGGAVSVWLLSTLGNTSTVMIAGALGTLSAMFFAVETGWVRRLATAAVFLVGAWCAVAFSGGLPTSTKAEDQWIAGRSWTIPFAPGKEMGGHKDRMPDVVLPSATAEVEVTTSRTAAPMIGGNFGVKDARNVEIRYVAQDGTAPTTLYRGAGKIEDFPFLDDSQAGSAYVCREAMGATNPNVLVIGVGGGVDVMVALAHEPKKVTAVEINDAMIEMVTDTFDDYLDGLFRPGAHPYSDRLRLVREEGRSFMRRQNERYDIIQMSGVDSFTALSTGAYTLSESYLYTVEAVKGVLRAPHRRWLRQLLAFHSQPTEEATRNASSGAHRASSARGTRHRRSGVASLRLPGRRLGVDDHQTRPLRGP